MPKQQEEDEEEEVTNSDEEMGEEEDDDAAGGAGIDSDQEMDEEEEYDESLIPDSKDKKGDLTLGIVSQYVEAYDLHNKWGDRTDWIFYSGDDGSKKIKAFQTLNSEMNSVSYHDIFSKSFKNHVLEDVDDENTWKADAMLSYQFGLLASGTIHIMLPEDADILKPYKDPTKYAYWYLYEIPAVLRKGGGVRRIVRYDAKKPDEDEGTLCWDRNDDDLYKLGPPSFDEEPKKDDED